MATETKTEEYRDVLAKLGADLIVNGIHVRDDAIVSLHANEARHSRMFAKSALKGGRKHVVALTARLDALERALEEN